MASIIDIARKAGVGKSTVARVLAGYGSSSSKSRERVLKAAEQLKYRSNTAARDLRRGESRLLGVVVPETGSRGFLSHAVGAQKLEGIARGAKRMGYDLQIFIENLSDAPALQRLAVEKSVRAFVFLGQMQESVLEHLNQYHIPWVIVNWHHPERPRDPYVWTDFEHAGFTLCNHLIERGCERVLAFDWLSIEYGRFPQGIQAAWKAARLPKKNLTIFSGTEYAHGAAVQQETQRFLADRPKHAGILCSHEEGAVSVYQTLKAARLTPGKDISVVSFDDLGITSRMEPPCTAYRQPFFEMGAIAVEELDKKLKGDESEIAIPVRGELIVR